MIPSSSISSLAVSSPVPLMTAAAAVAGSAGGATTVTPVRWPPAACAWPTRTPGTSVIALREPVGSRPTGPMRSRHRIGRQLGVVQQAGGHLAGVGGQQPGVDLIARLEALRAARMEAAAARDVGGVGQLALERDARDL